ncbi:MAG: cytidylate kinase-like family protein [Mariniphaga sp.]|nr:cytidylate kinase-like family protein [Mariniphaga sp.]
MKQTTPFVITISRQLGSGGAYIGQQLAKKLDIDYVDREILSLAAKQLALVEADLESRDERLLSFWNSFFHINGFAGDYQLPPQMNFPFDREIFDAETEVIKHIARDRSSVIIGRCGFQILREHYNCISLFLHADIAFRSKRVQEIYNLTHKAALEMITKNDKARTSYIETFTRKKWFDATQFDLTLDTGKAGLDKSVELILNYLEPVILSLKK